MRSDYQNLGKEIKDLFESFKSSNSLKVFILVFLIFALFAHWSSGSSDSIILTTQSFADNGSLSIDNYYDTGYTSSIEESEYSQFPPMTSLMALPSYFAVEAFLGTPTQEIQTSYFVQSPDLATSYLRLLSTISVSSLSGILSIFLLFKILNHFKPQKRDKNLAVSILAGSGSLIFAYSTVLDRIMPATLFLLSAVYLWIKTRDSEQSKTSDYLKIYLLLGLSISSSYILIIPTLSLIGIDIFRKHFRNEREVYLHKAVSGLIIGFFPLLIYNLFTVGSMFDFSLAIDLLKPSIPDAYAVVDIFVSPEIGLFLYSPLALLGLLSLVKLYKFDEELFVFISLSFVLSLITILFTNGWMSSTSFGLKYLVPVTTLLFISLGLSASEFSKKKLYGVYTLGIIGFLIQLTSTQPWTSESGLFEYYITNFGSQGLQSPIVNYVFTSSQLDLLIGPYPSRSVYLTNLFGLNVIYSQIHIIIGIIALSTLILFYKNVLEVFTGLHESLRKPHLFVILFLLVFSGIGTNTLHLDGWYNNQDLMNEKTLWSGKDPSIIFNSGSREELILKYDFQPVTPRNITLSLNGEEIETIELEEIHQDTRLLNLKEGSNMLDIDSDKECTTIGETTTGNDIRCTHIGLRNISLIRPEGGQLYPVSGIINENGQTIIDEEAKYLIGGKANYSLSFKPKIIGGETGKVSIYMDEEKIDEMKVDGFGSVYNSRYFHAEKLSELKINYSCKRGCQTLAIEELSIQDSSSQSKAILYKPGKNWYQMAENEDYQWSYDNSTINIYNYQNESIDKTLWIRGRSYSEPRVIDFKLNGENIGSRLVSDSNQRTETTQEGFNTVDNRQFFNVELKPGENILEIETDEKCTEPSNLNDIRCMNYGIKGLYLTDPHSSNLNKFKSIYGPEKQPLEPGKDKIRLFADYKTNLSLDGVFRAVEGDIQAEVRGEKINISSFPTRITTPYLAPENKTVDVSFECIGSDDCRIRVESADIQSQENHPETSYFRYGMNWYREIQNENTKWSKEGNSSIYFYNFDKETRNKDIELGIRSLNRLREVNFYIDNKLIDQRSIRSEYEKQGFDIKVEPGENILQIESGKCTSFGKVNNNDDIRCATIGISDIDY